MTAVQPASKPAALVVWQTITALHIGAAEADGSIDRPVIREAVTRLPYMPAEPQKSVVKQACRPRGGGPPGQATAIDAWNDLFGTQDVGQSIVQPQDGLLLALPVASDEGFCWVSSPHLLLRLMTRCGLAGIAIPAGCLPVEVLEGCCISSPLHLADLQLGSQHNSEAEALRFAWADWLANLYFPAQEPNKWPSASHWQALFKRRFVIVSDKTLSHLARVGMDVRPRRSGTERPGAPAGNSSLPENAPAQATPPAADEGAETEVEGADGNFWYDEHVPEGSLFWSLFTLQPRAAAKALRGDHGLRLASRWLHGDDRAIPGVPCPPAQVQIGGLASTGKGEVWMRVTPAPPAAQAPAATPAAAEGT